MLEIIRQILKKNIVIHNFLKNLINFLNLRILIRMYERKLFRNKINNNKNQDQKLKLIIGSGDEYFENWISSEKHTLDVTKNESWEDFFQPNEIDNILAEHVFEHFTIEDTENSLKNIHKYLKKNGCFRIAVPDGNFPSKEYIDWVKPYGKAPGADTHTILYNYKTLLEVLKKNKFKCRLIEYYDENSNFHPNYNYDFNGYVHRSSRNDNRNSSKKLNYTSLIIDAYKG